MDDCAFPSIKKFACTLTLLVCKPNTEVCPPGLHFVEPWIIKYF